MNSEKILMSMELTDDEYILEAAPENAKPMKSFRRKRIFRWAAAAAAVLALALIGGAVLLNVIKGSEDSAGAVYGDIDFGEQEYELNDIKAHLKYALSLASYPKRTAYDQLSREWSAQVAERRQLGSRANQPTAFTAKTVSVFLKGAGKENRVYSPLNAYFALCMLAETGNGSTRQQVLDLLGAGSIPALRANAENLWLSNYQNDGQTSSLLASSLWVDESLAAGGAYKESTANTLAEKYYASVFSGKMGSEGYNEALHAWINENTGGLLKGFAGKETFSENTVFALATTIYYKESWYGKFSSKNNTIKTFHGAKGDKAVEFMNSQDGDAEYYWGDNFTSAKLATGDGKAALWFILPDKGVSIDALLSDSEALSFITGSRPNMKRVKINYSVPKYDVSSNMDLIDGLQRLGVTDAFSSKADFSGLFSGSAVVGAVSHSARFAIDEEGVTGAAYTLIMLIGGMPHSQTKVVDFVLDRPFIFFMESDVGSTLFVGVVNNV